MAFDVTDFKALLEFQRRHGLDSATIEQLLKEHHLEPTVISELLDLAYTRYRTLAAWGGKAEFSRDIERIIRGATPEMSGDEE